MAFPKLFRAVFAGLMIAGIAACSESTSPVVTESADIALAKGGERGRPQADSGQATFWYYPTIGVWGSLGPHGLELPARSVCDPATTRYGVDQWDAPCEVATRPIRISARWFLKDGESHIQFTPDLRFVPTTNSLRWVTLSMRQERGEVSDASTILWWDQAQRRWVNEALSDPTLEPWLDRGGNRVTRRVKHFSGYVVGTRCGEGCEPPPGDGQY